MNHPAYAVRQSVVLHTFNGTARSALASEPQEDYWRLIGHRATVVSKMDERGRYLVQFEVNVTQLGLHCHNGLENALLILGTDLLPVPGSGRSGESNHGSSPFSSSSH